MHEPRITTLTANSMLVTSHTYASAGAWTPPAGMTEGYDKASGTANARDADNLLLFLPHAQFSPINQPVDHVVIVLHAIVHELGLVGTRQHEQRVGQKEQEIVRIARIR